MRHVTSRWIAAAVKRAQQGEDDYLRGPDYDHNEWSRVPAGQFRRMLLNALRTVEPDAE